MHEILDKVKSSPDIYKQLAATIESVEVRETQAISFVNPYSYLLLRNNRQLVADLDCLYTDAISSAKIFSLLFSKKIPRISFDLGSYARHFFEQANQHKFPIYLLGAKEAEINNAVAIFKKEYPNLNIVGYRDGYFSDDVAVMQAIVDSGAQYVICGMGTPRQDEFAVKLKQFQQGKIKQVYTCGGFLHQSSERLEYYPHFINRFNLRWLYRALTNSYVAKRLFFDYPKFVFKVLADFFIKSKGH